MSGHVTNLHGSKRSNGQVVAGLPMNLASSARWPLAEPERVQINILNWQERWAGKRQCHWPVATGDTLKSTIHSHAGHNFPLLPP